MLQLNCYWSVEQWRRGRLLKAFQLHNQVTTLGDNLLLDTMFGAAAKGLWYLGLIDSEGYALLSKSDTISDHSGWSEFTDYSEATRQLWTPDAAADGLATNSLAIDFNITADGTIRGGLLVNDNTKGGALGTLWGTSLWEETPVETGDIIKAHYGVQAG